MDDGRLAGEMTLEGLGETVRKIHDRLEAMDSKMSAMDSKMSAMDTKIDGVATELREGFARVDEELNNAKIRDEKLHALMTFGLEAREVLRDEMHRRFDASDRKFDEQIDLLKDVVRNR